LHSTFKSVIEFTIEVPQPLFVPDYVYATYEQFVKPCWLLLQTARVHCSVQVEFSSDHTVRSEWRRLPSDPMTASHCLHLITGYRMHHVYGQELTEASQICYCETSTVPVLW